METNECKCEDCRIPLKLKRFLMTIARREGIENINIGLIITDQNSRMIIEQTNTIPHKEIINGDIDATMTALLKDIGIGEMCIKSYIGSIDEKSDGRLVRQYNFEAKITDIPRELNANFKIANIEEGKLEFLKPDEARLLALLMEKRNDCEEKTD